jgi:signal transduction histidine kinase
MLLNLQQHASAGQRVEPPTPQSATEELRRLLVVDDEVSLLMLLGKLFRRYYDVQTAESGEQALEMIAQGFIPQVIIADQRMPGMSGAEFLAKSRDIVPKAVRIILTGYTDVNDIIDSINLGHAYRFLTKPWNNQDLLETVRAGFTYYDISTQNSELTRLLRSLEELHQEKNEILGIVAHDLKNPIGAIRFSADIIRESFDELPKDEVLKFASIISDSSDRMIQLITNLLDINAIERGGMNLELVPCNLNDVAHLTVDAYIHRAEVKQMSLRYTNEATINTVLADATALPQVVENLVSNAVKYSPWGKEIVVRLCEGNALGGVPSLRLEIQDQGPGISPEDMKKLFGKFARLSAQPTGGEHSTGLGLSIVKKMVELMHGNVWCESTLGNGATFIVELPKALA